jgi:hypothetical protein
MPSRSGYLEILSWCTDSSFPRVCAPKVLLPVFPWLAANAAFRSSSSYEVCVSPRGECHLACLLKDSFCCSFLCCHVSCGLGLTLQFAASGVRSIRGLARAQLLCLCVAPALRAGRSRLIFDKSSRLAHGTRARLLLRVCICVCQRRSLANFAACHLSSRGRPVGDGAVSPSVVCFPFFSWGARLDLVRSFFFLLVSARCVASRPVPYDLTSETMPNLELSLVSCLFL